MTTPTQRLRDLETVARSLRPEECPTRYFFVADRVQAAAGYGGQTAAEILAAVEAVDRTIRAIDELRATQRLDLIDTAIVIRREAYPDYAQDAQAIASSLVEAHFHWDTDRHGRDHAWRQQRSAGRFDGQIAARLARPMAT